MARVATSAIVIICGILVVAGCLCLPWIEGDLTPQLVAPLFRVQSLF